MQLSPVVFIVVVIGSATCLPAVPILSQLSEIPRSAKLVRTSAQLLRLPARQQQVQQPQSVYGVYAPPEVTTEEEEEKVTSTTELPTTTEISSISKQEQLKDVEKYDEEGVYYIYHPDGLLQKVVYGTRIEDMGYSAKLSYKDVEPIKEPIYTYDPKTLVFSQIQI